MSLSNRVVITGVGLISPLGSSIELYWDKLKSGRSGIKPITKFNPERFHSRLAAEVDDSDINIRVKQHTHEIKRMDRFVLLAIAAAEDALLNSGIPDSEIQSVNNRVYTGVGLGGLPNIEKGILRQETTGSRSVSPYLIPSLIPNMAASMIALRNNFKGHQYTIAGSCAGGIQAIGQAYHSIRNGDCEWALAGGTESVITPITFSGFEAMRALSKGTDANETPRPFDQHRDGMIVGEGAAFFVLENYTRAKARGGNIFGELQGYSLHCGGQGMALQSVSETLHCMKLALQDAALDHSAIDCIFAQASGMVKGDECELNALKILLDNRFEKSAVTSIKGHVGHTFAASGPLNLVAALLSLKKQIVPPTLNFNGVDPLYSGMNIIQTPCFRSVNHCLINAFGFGGINASLIVSKGD